MGPAALCLQDAWPLFDADGKTRSASEVFDDFDLVQFAHVAAVCRSSGSAADAAKKLFAAAKTSPKVITGGSIGKALKVLGFLPEAKAAAEKFAAFLKAEGVKTLYVSNPAAVNALKQDYPAFGVKLPCDVKCTAALVVPGKIKFAKPAGEVYALADDFKKNYENCGCMEKALAALKATCKPFGTNDEETYCCGEGAVVLDKLHPELVKALEREVVRQKKSVDGLNVVPNEYTIFLSDEDCHRLSAARVLNALYEAVERKIIRENCFMDGALRVKIEKMTDGDAVIRVESRYVSADEFVEDTINLENDVLSKTLLENGDTTNGATIVADKTKICATMKSSTRKITYNLAVITDSQTSEIVLGEGQVYLGRKETNDFVLKDDGASRIHAYISYERHRHVLRDAGSLNGTFVNKKPVTRCDLRHGDKILIGSTTLVYKVL